MDPDFSIALHTNSNVINLHKSPSAESAADSTLSDSASKSALEKCTPKRKKHPDQPVYQVNKKVWKNLCNILGGADSSARKKSPLDRLSSLFKFKNEKNLVVPLTDVGISPNGFRALVSETVTERKGADVAIAVMLPSGVSMEDIDVNVEVELGEFEKLMGIDNRNITEMKCSEETMNSTVFSGYLSLPPSTSIVQVKNMPLYIIDTYKQSVLHPDVRLRRKVFSQSPESSYTHFQKPPILIGNVRIEIKKDKTDYGEEDDEKPEMMDASTETQTLAHKSTHARLRKGHELIVETTSADPLFLPDVSPKESLTNLAAAAETTRFIDVEKSNLTSSTGETNLTNMRYDNLADVVEESYSGEENNEVEEVKAKHKTETTIIAKETVVIEDTNLGKHVSDSEDIEGGELEDTNIAEETFSNNTIEQANPTNIEDDRRQNIPPHISDSSSIKTNLNAETLESANTQELPPKYNLSNKSDQPTLPEMKRILRESFCSLERNTGLHLLQSGVVSNDSGVTSINSEADNTWKEWEEALITEIPDTPSQLLIEGEQMYSLDDDEPPKSVNLKANEAPEESSQMGNVESFGGAKKKTGKSYYTGNNDEDDPEGEEDKGSRQCREKLKFYHNCCFQDFPRVEDIPEWLQATYRQAKHAEYAYKETSTLLSSYKETATQYSISSITADKDIDVQCSLTRNLPSFPPHYYDLESESSSQIITLPHITIAPRHSDVPSIDSTSTYLPKSSASSGTKRSSTIYSENFEFNLPSNLPLEYIKKDTDNQTTIPEHADQDAQTSLMESNENISENVHNIMNCSINLDDIYNFAVGYAALENLDIVDVEKNRRSCQQQTQTFFLPYMQFNPTGGTADVCSRGDQTEISQEEDKTLNLLNDARQKLSDYVDVQQYEEFETSVTYRKNFPHGDVEKELKELQETYKSTHLYMEKLLDIKDLSYGNPEIFNRKIETEMRIMEVLNQNLTNTYMEMKTCLTNINEMMKVSNNPKYQTHPNSNEASDESIRKEDMSEEVTYRSSDFSSSLLTTSSSASKSTLQEGASTHSIDKNQTYFVMEDEIERTIKELLKESGDIKQTAILNGAPLETEPPFSFGYIMTPEVFCRKIVEEIVEKEVGAKSKPSNEARRDVEYILDLLVDKATSPPAKDKKVEIPEIIMKRLAENSGDAPNTNEDKPNHSFKPKNEPLVCFCNATAFIPKIPKTAFSFGETPNGCFESPSPECKTPVKLRDGLTIGIENKGQHWDTSRLFSELLNLQSEVNEDDHLKHGIEENPFATACDILKESQPEIKIPQDVSAFKAHYDLDISENNITTITLTRHAVNEDETDDKVDNAQAQSSQEEDAAQSPKEDNRALPKSNKHFQLTQDIKKPKPLTESKPPKSVSTTEEEVLIQDVDLTRKSYSTSTSAEATFQVLVQKRSLVSASSSEELEFFVPTHMISKNNICEAQCLATESSSEDEAADRPLRRPSSKKRRKKDDRNNVPQDDSQILLKPTAAVPDIQEKMKRSHTEEPPSASPKGVLGSVTRRVNFSDLSFRNTSDVTDVEYEGDHDETVQINLPNPRHRYKSVHEFNSPDEIAAIEENVRQNIELERRNMAVLINSASSLELVGSSPSINNSISSQMTTSEII